MRKHTCFGCAPHRLQICSHRRQILPCHSNYSDLRREENHDASIGDSGATVSVFRSEVAESLELPWEKGERVVITSANASFNAYLHSLEAVIGQLAFVLKLGFSDSLTTSFNILGRETFFETFDIAISEKNRTIMLEPATTSEQSPQMR